MDQWVPSTFRSANRHTHLELVLIANHTRRRVLEIPRPVQKVQLLGVVEQVGSDGCFCLHCAHNAQHFFLLFHRCRFSFVRKGHGLQQIGLLLFQYTNESE